MDPLVSIVIPLHNQASFVGESIASCLEQTYPRIEVIVVDDASTDTSLAIAQGFEPRVRVVALQANVGSCAARNAGLAQACGDLVLFHDSDDVLFPEAIRQDVRALESVPRADAVISANRCFRDGERVSRDWRPIFRSERRRLRHLAAASGSIEQALLSILRYGGPQHSCVMYRASRLRQLGGYADGTEPFSDRELLFRALCREARVIVQARVTCAWRQYESPQRMTSQMRSAEPAHRLMLATRYHALLEEAGLLDREAIKRALIGHVAGWVHAYATRCEQPDVARAALGLIAQLSLRPRPDDRRKTSHALHGIHRS